MKTIKSNPSRVLNTYVMPAKEEIVVSSVTGSRVLKLTEIAIMDRQSNGSFIVKDRILNTHKVVGIVSNVKENEILSVNNDKEYKSLKNIDEQMMIIDKQLDDIEN